MLVRHADRFVKLFVEEDWQVHALALRMLQSLTATASLACSVVCFGCRMRSKAIAPSRATPGTAQGSSRMQGALSAVGGMQVMRRVHANHRPKRSHTSERAGCQRRANILHGQIQICAL